MSKFRIALLVAVVLAAAASAVPVRHALGLFTVGFTGIVNQADVCNGWHPDVCPVAFSDQVFQDRILWVQEETAAETVAYWALPVSCGPGIAVCLNWTPTFLTFKKGSATFDTGAREIIQGVEAVRVGALQSFGAPQSQIALKWYPGYEARHPSQGNPIGDAWPDHPYARNGWRMFRDKGGDKWAQGEVFQLNQRRWRKYRAVIKPGSGPFGGGGEVADAWAEETLR